MKKINGMAMVSKHELGILCVLLGVCLSAVSVTSNSEIHVIHLSEGRPDKTTSNSHRAILEVALGSSESVDGCLIYCYENVFDGFAAKLTPEQATKLSGMDGVLSVVKNSYGKLQTTNTWKFLGVESQNDPTTGPLWEQAQFGEDMIIGVIDTGVYPESPSFSDAGLGPIPERWKGECVEADQFTKDNCNRKLIGAKYYYQGNPNVNERTFQIDYKSPRDMDGHGTHVASTAVGAFVQADSATGYCNGTAKGGAPHARLAVYKVCWQDAMCSFADVAAAIEDAIKDGVDVISISIGSSNDQPLYEDINAISAFHAMRKNILVNFAGGNDGPNFYTVNHVEPWSFTVAASTQDRFLGSEVHIGLAGNKLPSFKLRGATLAKFDTISAPLALASDLKSADEDSAKYCFKDSLEPSKVEGKIVFCLVGDLTKEDVTEKGETVLEAGGLGMIVGNTDEASDFGLQYAAMFSLPAVHVKAADAVRIQKYMSIPLRKVVATIFPGKTLVGASVKQTPKLADFSSLGPNGVTRDILKPDITAPGVYILAALPYETEPYGLLSGTSMATPQIAAIVALLKQIHPRWSPAAIKSAIMTTARVLDNSKKPIKDSMGKPAIPFGLGSGLVNPVKAADPGLIYEAGPRDYTLFLCALGYTDVDVEVITGEAGFCSSEKYFPSTSNLNYPSLSVGNLTMEAVTVTRRVTNVGAARSLYIVKIEPPEGVEVTITPSILRFTRAYEVKSFSVKLERTKKVSLSEDVYFFGSYTWSDGEHKVRSPIVVGSQPYFPSLES